MSKHSPMLNMGKLRRPSLFMAFTRSFNCMLPGLCPYLLQISCGMVWGVHACIRVRMCVVGGAKEFLRSCIGCRGVKGSIKSECLGQTCLKPEGAHTQDNQQFLNIPSL